MEIRGERGEMGEQIMEVIAVSEQGVGSKGVRGRHSKRSSSWIVSIVCKRSVITQYVIGEEGGGGGGMLPY